MINTIDPVVDCMAGEQLESPTAKCYKCGFRAPQGSAEWERADHPSLGSLTKCPECGSTDIQTLW